MSNDKCIYFNEYSGFCRQYYAADGYCTKLKEDISCVSNDICCKERQDIVLSLKECRLCGKVNAVDTVCSDCIEKAVKFVKKYDKEVKDYAIKIKPTSISVEDMFKIFRVGSRDADI